MVVRLGEKTDRTTQSNLKMGRLHLAVCEVSGQFEAPADVLRFFLDNAPLLNLDGNA